MKKLCLMAAVVAVAAGTALAGSINVPFFLDDTTNGIAYIGLKNNDMNNPVVCTVRYFRANGLERTPAANTFVIPANSAISWRPVGDTAEEGAGRAVPNMALLSGEPQAGSATISWAGDANAIQGRLFEERPGKGSSAYTLPPGL